MKKLSIHKFGITEAQESTETENTIHFEPYTFQISHILSTSTSLHWCLAHHGVPIDSMQLRNSAFCILQVQHLNFQETANSTWTQYKPNVVDSH